ncbi:MAG: methyltransferase [Actinomycetota bacterium]
MTGKTEDLAVFEERLRRDIEAYHASALVYTAAKLGLPDTMGEQAWTAEELAGVLGALSPHLYRFLRGLVTISICEELGDGRFKLTPGGALLRSVSPSPAHLDKKVQIIVEQYWRPWADLHSVLKTGEPSFDHVFGASVAEWRKANPQQGEMFESYLAAQTFDQAASILEVMECAAEAKTVADIGGGCGALLAPLLIAFPHLKGVLLDKPPMIEMAKAFLKVFDQFRFRERIDLVAGDFFAGVPVKADLYLLKGVLQQWDDVDAVAILRNCRNAMPKDARLVIIERLMPERAADDPASVILDLHMMIITGGRTRSGDEFKHMLEAASLIFSRVTPTTSGLALIEAVRG